MRPHPGSGQRRKLFQISEKGCLGDKADKDRTVQEFSTAAGKTAHDSFAMNGL